MLAFRLFCLQLACLMIVLTTAEKNITILLQLAQPQIQRTIPTIPLTSSLPRGYIYYSDVATAFKLSTDRLDWPSARDKCYAEGARLAVIDTSRKLQYIVGVRMWLDWVWTGIYRETWGSFWKAVGGGSLNSNLPWSFISNFLPGGNCVAVSGLVHGLGNWLCGIKKLYVCEIPGRRI